MALQRFDLSITLLSPFITGGDADPTFGLDARLPRAAGGREPIIPGALVRGVLRDALQSLCARGGGHAPGAANITSDVVSALFGRASSEEDQDDDGAGGAPRRGLLAFGDLRAITPPAQTPDTLTRIEIDEQLGSAREGHLQVVELLWPIGEKVEFKGEIAAREGLNPSVIEQALRAGLAVIPAMGGAKSAGYGALAGFALASRPSESRAAASVRARATLAYRATLVFDGPFLVAADRVAPNVFAGSAYPPGAAIKGAVADAWGVKDDSSPEGLFLARTVFREAWPHLENGQRSIVPPFSLAIYRDGAAGALLDTLSDTRPGPLNIRGVNLPPVFAIDWKDADSSAAQSVFTTLAGFPSADAAAGKLDRQVRTRTRIDYETGTADQGDGSGGGLFVYDLVAPSAGGNPVSWRFDIKLETADDRPMLDKLSGTEFLVGKAPTAARITGIEPIAGEPILREFEKGAFALHLVTPALLTPMERLRHHGGDVAATYLETFTGIFGRGVIMRRFFARQRLIGGWQAMRYRARPGGAYEPWVLTEAGSVFLLSPPRDRVNEFKAALTDVLAKGLPEQGAPAGALWRVCPFPRTNGYGEVRLWKPARFRANFPEAR